MILYTPLILLFIPTFSLHPQSKFKIKSFSLHILQNFKNNSNIYLYLNFSLNPPYSFIYSSTHVPIYSFCFFVLLHCHCSFFLFLSFYYQISYHCCIFIHIWSMDKHIIVWEDANVSILFHKTWFHWFFHFFFFFKEHLFCIALYGPTKFEM